MAPKATSPKHVAKKKEEPEDDEDEEEEEEEEESPIEFVNGLPDGAKQTILACQSVQQKYQELFLAYVKEEATLQKKYEALYAPLNEERKALVSGEREPTAEEVKRGEEAKEKEQEEKGESTSKVEELPDEDGAEKKPVEEEAGEAKKGIPDFWFTALSNHDNLQEIIKDWDKDCLKHITDIRAKTDEDPHTGFEIEFDFSENPYFDNKTLTKRVVTKLDEEDGEDMVEKLIGCNINWKAGKNLTVELKKKKQRSKQGKGTRVVTKEQPRESFFDFFNPPDLPDDDDEEIEEEVQEKAQEDYMLSCNIRESLLPRAVDYFTGEMVPQLQMMEDDDDDDDDDDEEGDSPKKKKKEGADGAPKEECKQQ